MRRGVVLLSGLAILAIAAPAITHAQSDRELLRPQRGVQVKKVGEERPAAFKALPRGDFWRPGELRQMRRESTPPPVTVPR